MCRVFESSLFIALNVHWRHLTQKTRANMQNVFHRSVYVSMKCEEKRDEAKENARQIHLEFVVHLNSCIRVCVCLFICCAFARARFAR